MTYIIPFVKIPEVIRYEQIAEAHYLSVQEIKDNWKPKDDTYATPLKFLISKAKSFAAKKGWVNFNALLAYMIYGVVLFSNIENYVGLIAICVFMNKNSVPTLLGDTYHSIHSRYKKGV